MVQCHRKQPSPARSEANSWETVVMGLHLVYRQNHSLFDATVKPSWNFAPCFRDYPAAWLLQFGFN
jgi:hypothetical protein